MVNEVQELVYARLDNNLLDQAIEWMIDRPEEYRDDRIACWLIQAKQYRNLELKRCS